MAIMTLELWYIFKDYIIKSVYLQCASVKFPSKIAEMIDIVLENTHAKNQGRILRNLICCSTLCELLI